ncbi:MAG: HPF/RaiA family ribosome-associated protein [Bryobacteraceae bacterium]|nr:HPF/RaiA family ribosome-associated protein [Bryobacteraceae bacterium]
MQIAYTGKPHDLTKEQSDRLTLRLTKLGKLIDGKMVDGKSKEKKAHFILSQQRHLTKAEITLHYYGHDLIGIATHADKFRALSDALEKLEHQVQKLRQKWIDSKHLETSIKVKPVLDPASENGKTKTKAKPAKPRLYRVRFGEAPKPMLPEEAVLEVAKRDNYFVFEDTENGGFSVLVRRPDGHFDLIEPNAA